jgi:hypothetical protein
VIAYPQGVLEEEEALAADEGTLSR